MRKSFNPMDYPRLFRMIINLWPPFVGAGIRVREISPDWRRIRVEMRLHWYNRNYVNSHFGGSLFAMSDPFYMLMLIRNLGRDYIVWDMSAKIKFLRPGKKTVCATFTLAEDRLQAIRDRVATGEKQLEKFLVEILDQTGERVAVVDKTLYIRKKNSVNSGT